MWAGLVAAEVFRLEDIEFLVDGLATNDFRNKASLGVQTIQPDNEHVLLGRSFDISSKPRATNSTD